MKAVALALCLVVVYCYPPEKLYRGIEEYNDAAINYLTIKNEFPILEWTIVAPPEQLAQVMDYGWHYEILRFVQRFNLAQANNEDFDIPIPTRHIFFFTEKRPLNFGREITVTDAEIALEPEGDDPFMQYYHNKEQRAILEAKAINWLEAYSKSHQNISTYYEDENIKIYHVEHDPEII